MTRIIIFSYIITLFVSCAVMIDQLPKASDILTESITKYKDQQNETVKGLPDH